MLKAIRQNDSFYDIGYMLQYCSTLYAIASMAAAASAIKPAMQQQIWRLENGRKCTWKGI